MKKGLMILSLGLALGMVVYAGTISVPLVFDDGGDGVVANNFAPDSGTASFIAVTNASGGAVTCTLAYTDPLGADVTPLTGNTFVIAAQQAIGFRPYATDVDAESPGLAGLNATGAIPAIGTTISYAGTPQMICRVGVCNSTCSFGYQVMPY